MGRNRDEKIRKLQNSGRGSYTVSLPVKAIRELKWQENQKLAVEYDKGRKRFIIKDWKK